MHEPNVEAILGQIGPGDVVLDIGGWALPFNRATHVIDMMPYQSRGTWQGNYRSGSQGGEREFFDERTWFVRDLCDRSPLPFADKSVDFVICSHTLEDIRDPLWVCAEMIRIGKRGYIEVPSRLAESSRGIERGIVGWSHHRWLIEIEGHDITFMPKYHMIHRSRQLHFPAWFSEHAPDNLRIQWLFWEGTFEFRERLIHGVDAIEQELHGFAAKHHATVAAVARTIHLKDWAKYYARVIQRRVNGSRTRRREL